MRSVRALRFGAQDREIIRLAVPALGALIAEPLYILADTAVVGHLGTDELGGLALASQSLLITHSLFIFLAYGTTAAVARLLGAGDERRAADQAVQSLWLAFGAGVVFAAGLWVWTDPLLRLLGAQGAILEQGRIYLRISLLGLPAMLIALAGVGYLRGLQDTVRPLYVALITAVGNLVLELVLIYGFDLGIGASALSTVIALWSSAAIYIWWIRSAVAAHGVDMRPDTALIRRLAVVGVDLFVRTAALRASFTVTVAVAARLGPVELAAHEITFQLYNTIALALDSIAIAGQAIIGRVLGASRSDEARAFGRRLIGWGLTTGIVAAALLLALRPVLPQVFSDDDAVVALTGFLVIHLALMQPLAGVVFALDGLLIGAGDLRFLAWAMLGAAVVFIPLALSVGIADAGIGWLWGTIWVLMTLRVIALVARFRSDAWLRLGA